MANFDTFDGEAMDDFEPLGTNQENHNNYAINLIAHKVNRLSTDMQGVMLNVSKMADSMTVLVRIEERQLNINSRIDELVKLSADKEVRLRALEIVVPDKVDVRLNDIERSLPSLVETRKWVIMGVLAGVGMIGAALLKLVFIK